ncbi:MULTISPECIES: restriction endonuclease subunit S [Bacillus]|uniref:restriction endonuclease subunit S n=1 Tax=Bacillus TaxID=1386 RepID=UPI000BC2E76A|nr:MULTISPECIES: restriction endonuclease subunit S [Bacillus]ATH73682.1 restriction endonuclease subunit S [Bacillus altitudinis]MDJ0286680.1 restriction endonuclease subunit S [Bacillus altitudinis]
MSRELKDSGVEWIGIVPANWSVEKIKYTTYVKGRIGWQGLKSDEFTDEGPYLVTGTNFIGKGIDWGSCHHISKERYHEAPPIQLKEDDLLITKDGTIGKTAIVRDMPDKAILNSGIFVTRSGKYEVDFMYWMLNSQVFDKYIKFFETGSTIKHLYQETFENFSYPLPTRLEQKKISLFLNRKIKLVDEVIKNKENMMTLLEKQRQSIITEAVTKGLNPNVKMKDSGIEWIGEIPEHWEISKLKYHAVRIGDGLHGTPVYDDQGEYHFINGNNLGDISIRFNEKTNKINKAEFISHGQKIGGNTILVSLNGTIGNVSIYNNEKIMLSKSAGFINLKNNIETLYVYYWLKSIHVENYFTKSFAGTTIKNLSLETLRNTPILIVPIIEQQQIAKYLVDKLKENDSLLEKVKIQIEKLKEYRQSLIYEAVTGKIDVSEMELLEVR